MLKVNCHVLLRCLPHSLEGVPTILDSLSSQHENLSEIVYVKSSCSEMVVNSQPRSQGSLLPALRPTEWVGENPGNEVG